MKLGHVCAVCVFNVLIQCDWRQGSSEIEKCVYYMCVSMFLSVIGGKKLLKAEIEKRVYCMCVCVCVLVYARMCNIYIYIYIHAYIHTHTYARMHTLKAHTCLCTLLVNLVTLF
jgi:hypothetical protein